MWKLFKGPDLVMVELVMMWRLFNGGWSYNSVGA